MRKRKAAHTNGFAKYLTIPYFVLCFFFLLMPLSALIISSFGRGLDSIRSVLSNETYLKSFLNSVILSIAVTLEAAAVGGLLAVIWAKKIAKKSWFLPVLNFAANNGGITLAFAFIATLGTNGLLTILLKEWGIFLYPGFDLVSLLGLNFAYLSFLLPYMTILFLPAAGCIRAEWWQAAQTLGASRIKYIVRVAGPVLFPSFLSSACLVFLTALGTYATAQALSANRIHLITLKIGYLIQTSVFKQVDAYTLSFLLMIIMSVFVLIYRKANSRAGRWLS